MAISGWVNTLEHTVFSRSGATPSPSACHIAIRPCMAATEASISTPVQSPGGVDAGHRGPGHPVHLDEPAPVEPDPDLRPGRCPSVLGTAPTVISACEPAISRPSSRVTTHAVALRGFTDFARARLASTLPREEKTFSMTAAASASSLGSTRSRLDTSVTLTPISV